MIVVEDLAVANLSRRKPGAGKGGRGLNRALADAALGELRRQLGYKATWYGSTLIVADRWYPSSKTCSSCETVKAKLSLSERTYWCDACGMVADRDVNAARNLLKLAASGAESLDARGGTVRPGLAGRVPANLEPGTRKRDKTGTASGQPLAAA